jgi:hypothetical protein
MRQAGRKRAAALRQPLRSCPAITPSTSIFVDGDEASPLRQLAGTRDAGGQEMMPRASHGFSTLFTGIADRYEVSWQLNLP